MKTVELTEEQQRAADRAIQSLRRGSSLFRIAGLAGTGKALAVDTKIATPDGWIEMGDICPGQKVFSQDGSQTTVIACSPIEYGRKCYRVTFDDGESIVADGSHLWVTLTERERVTRLTRTEEWRKKRRESRKTSGQGIRIRTAPPKKSQKEPMAPLGGVARTTEEILRTLEKRPGRKEHSVDMASPIECGHKKFKIDPYLLGVWLGDGTTGVGGFTSADKEIVAALREKYQVKGKGKYGHHAKRLVFDLRAAGVADRKHIPQEFFRGSASQRVALLQGLMDSDGYSGIGGRSMEFSSTNESLAAGMIELLNSLGIKTAQSPTIGEAKLYGRVVSKKWRVTFTTKIRSFRLARKLLNQSPAIRPTTRARYVASIEPVESVPVRCIQVDHESKMYLAGKGMVPTHNSTIAKHIVEQLGESSVNVCAFTGKAACVLRRKGLNNAHTIHRTIYRFDKKRDKFVRKERLEGKYILVDEGSMVSKGIWEDLCSYRLPTLVIGDHGQLEPVGDDPKLMKDADVVLEKIHRQAAESPIIEFAWKVRNGQPFRYGTKGPVTIAPKREIDSSIGWADQFLCGFNRTRVAMNQKIRKYKGYSGFLGLLEAGERIVCLKNDYDLGVFNGQMFTVNEVSVNSAMGQFTATVVDDDGNEMKVPIWTGHFNQEKSVGQRILHGLKGTMIADYGYCLSAHKFQGSEDRNVAVIDEQCDMWEAARWRYTTATRASESLRYYINLS